MRPFIAVLILAVGLSSGRWVRQDEGKQVTAFVGEAIHDLSTALFQSYIDDNRNLAFSPLGYSTILAILLEGATGETRHELELALRFPQDLTLARKSYRYILERLKNTNQYKYNQPELKNYFYVYKNYTIKEQFKRVLQEYYLTDVRSVERYNADHIDDDNEESNAGTEYVIDDSTKKPEEKVDDIPELMPPKETEKLISFAVEDTPEKVDVSEIEYKPAKNIKEKIKLVKTYSKKDESNDEEETMVAVEARNHGRSLRILQDKHDISSSLSVNSVGKKSNKKSSSNSLMIIFNGMYFRGSWKKPFDRVEQETFYMSADKQKEIPMMKTKGVFKTVYAAEWDAEAIQLPYDGDRYALVVVVPRLRDGLARLAADLSVVPLTDIQDDMKEQEMELSLPSFYVETTTKPIAGLSKFGVSSIFSREAELKGISSDEGLFVQELVQHVAVRVDNADASASQMTAGNLVVEQTKNLPLSPVAQEKQVRQFKVEHPFIFYIVDVIDNLVVVAGKVIEPEQPTSFDI